MSNIVLGAWVRNAARGQVCDSGALYHQDTVRSVPFASEGLLAGQEDRKGIEQVVAAPDSQSAFLPWPSCSTQLCRGLSVIWNLLFPLSQHLSQTKAQNPASCPFGTLLSLNCLSRSRLVRLLSRLGVVILFQIM